MAHMATRLIRRSTSSSTATSGSSSGGRTWVLLVALVFAAAIVTVTFRGVTPMKVNEGKTIKSKNEEAQQPTDSFSLETSGDNKMLSCLKTALEQLPILPVTDPTVQVRNGKNQVVPIGSAVWAHHGDAGNWQMWNKAIASRSFPLPQLQKDPCSVWEVGANTVADASRQYMKLYPACQYHAFEPIPDFVQKLQENWKGENRMHIHAYGLADKDGSFLVNPQDLNGESTFIGDSSGGTIKANIKNFNQGLADAGGIPTLLDVNCEGCEYDFFLQAKQHGFVEKVPVIQIGWHNYGSVGVGVRAWQLCQVRTQLSETHTMVEGLAFGWDRWVLK